jgi:hypothetical protein
LPDGIESGEACLQFAELDRQGVDVFAQVGIAGADAAPGGQPWGHPGQDGLGQRTHGDPGQQPAAEGHREREQPARDQQVGASDGDGHRLLQTRVNQDNLHDCNPDG